MHLKNRHIFRLWLIIFGIVGSFTSLLCQPSLDTTDLEAFLGAYQVEKIYVAHDKPSYAPGETIWCKVYLVDGQRHQSFSGTPVVYVDWISPAGKAIKSYTLQVVKGYALLDIPTEDRDTTGAYTLRAYTQFQRNFGPQFYFQKEIDLLDFRSTKEEERATDSTSLAVSFFPEGGHLVEGLESTVAFRAENADREGVNIEGVLVNQAGAKVGEVFGLHEGIGLIKLIPQANERYFIRTTYGGQAHEFTLPPALPEGFVLKVSTRSSKEVRLSIKANLVEGTKGCLLVGHLRGEVFLVQELDGSPAMTLTLAKEEVPSGLMHFTLFDGQGRPVAERLAFNKNPTESVSLSPETDEEFYGTRRPVRLKLEGLSPQLDSATTVSLSVYYDEAATAGIRGLDIKNYLWLQSELRGNINNIGQYFTEDSPRINTLLDLILMTHGWRKFNWQDILQRKKPRIVLPPEEHLTIAGKVTRLERDKPVRAEVQLSVLSPAYFSALNVTTEEDGIFAFRGFDFRDTVDVLLQANVYNERQVEKLREGEFRRTGSRFVDIALLDVDQPEIQLEYNISAKIYFPETLKRYAYLVAQERASVQDPTSAFSVNLDEVTVSSGRNRAQIREQEIENLYDEKGLFYFGTTQKFRADDPQFADFKYRTVFDQIGHIVPRAYMVTAGGRPRVLYGSPVNGVEPTLVVDGTIASASSLLNLNPNDIAVIDVLEGDYAKLYDDDGVVISLVTKRPENIKRPNPGIKTLTHPGFYRARTFFSPDYATFTSEDADYRTTLYWEPELNPEAQAEVEFYTGDRPGRYTVWVEGITAAGLPFTGRTSFVIR
ncbi:hypothetical protein [Lewinella sp. W8]|uniref:hypothetical protein n=1 Tax=Lewinella sp. W8 TaxID=2528208 RepID=UPI0010676FFF|nr:hypothetical protein [Lewinella sp. W8]MTB50276.1 hypothetical protein [Lewinella sp. W8]